MTSLIKGLTNIIFGKGQDEKLKELLEKIGKYEANHVVFFTKSPGGHMIKIYSMASLKFDYHQRKHRFYLRVEDLDPNRDDEDDDSFSIPILPETAWEIHSPENDSDEFEQAHSFDFSGCDEPSYKDCFYRLEFTSDEKTNVIDQLETLINEVLDFVEEAQKQEKASEEEKKEEPGSTPLSDQFSNSLFECQGHLFVYDKEKDQNEVIDENVYFLVLPLEQKFEYAFTVLDKDNNIIMRTKITANTTASLNKEHSAIMWIHDSIDDNGEEEIDAYCFYFLESKDNDMDTLSHVVSKVIFESKEKVEFEVNVKEDDMDWLADAYVEDNRDEDEKSEYDPDQDMYDGFEDDPMGECENPDQDFNNADMTQALTYDRAFVARGNGYGVYSASGKDEIKWYGDFNIIKEYEGKPAENMTLYDNENKLLFIDPSKRDKIQCYDFNKEKIVEEWEAQGASKINSFYGEYKNAQSTPNNNIIACSEKGMFTLDPRVNNSNKAVQSKMYSTNYLFNKIASTLEGKIAVASKNGEIRMYTKMGQNAKTMLPGAGQNITGMDLTKDGNWILATTEKYILLIPTKCRNGKTGFEHKMGKEKPKPRKLKLNNSDVIKHGLKSFSFTKATFDNSDSLDESLIVAAIGNFVVVWKLKQVVKGNLGQYDIKKVHNPVVASECRYNTDNELLVTMPKCLTKESRRAKD